MAKHNIVGEIGESVSASWLEKRGYSVFSRNYRQKWGEIDIVARETDVVHFVEVKTVSYETIERLNYAVSHETHRPEENVHSQKLLRLGRAIETWILENNYEGKWQIDVVTVRLVPDKKYAKIKLIENVILE